MGLLSRLRDLLAPPAPVSQPQAEPDARPLVATWGPIEVPAGAIREVRIQVQSAFQGTRLMFGGDEGARRLLVLESAIVGRTVQRFPEMTPLRGRTDMEILWDAAEPTDVITLRVRNVSAEPALFSGTLFGRLPLPAAPGEAPTSTSSLLRALLHNLVVRTTPVAPEPSMPRPDEFAAEFRTAYTPPARAFQDAMRYTGLVGAPPARGDALVGTVTRLTSAFAGAMLREVRIAIGLPATPRSPRDTRTIMLPFPETTIPYGASRDIQVLPQSRFRCERLVLAEDIASHVVIDDIRIGTVSQFAATGPVDGSTFSPDAVGTGLILDTVEPGLTVLLRVRSKGTMPELSGEAETNSGGILFRASMLGAANP